MSGPAGPGWGPLGTILLLAAAACGVAALPPGACDPIWWAALSVPAALLWAMGRAPWPGPVVRLVLVALLQVSAIAVALQMAAPLSPPAALACSLCPPLTYTLCRRQGSDAVLALFLSFCLLLVGGMLGIGGPGWLHGGFFAAAVGVLWLDAGKSLRRTRPGIIQANTTTGAVRQPRPQPRDAQLHRARHPAGSGLGVALGVLLVAAATAATAHEGLTLLHGTADTTDSRRTHGGNPGQSEVGLSPTFDLDGGGNPVLDAGGATILMVQSRDGEAVPGDLYLRSRTFTRAGLSAWLSGPAPAGQRSRRWRLRPVRADSRRLRLIRLGMHDGEVFVPTGTQELRTDSDVLGDPVVRVLREQDPIGDLIATATVGDADGYGVSGTVLLGAYPELQRLPAALRTGRFATWGQGIRAGLARTRSSGNLLPLCRAVADRIRANHSYQLAEPRGPYRHAIENFLFGPDQAGFCMHFATALAIALRQVDIPARIAVGLMGGEPDPQAPGDRVYRAAHAHAWVEVPVRLGDGTTCWAVFDATAAGELVGGGWPASVSRIDPMGDAGGVSAGADALVDPARQRVLVLAALLLCAGGLLRWLPTRRPRTHQPRPAPQVAQVLREGEQLRRLLHRQLGWATARPTLEALQRRLERSVAAGEVEADTAAIRAAVTALQEVRFGGRHLEDDRSAAIQQGLVAAGAAIQRHGNRD